MRCDTCIQQLSAYVDGELTNEEEQAVKAHLATCTACQDELYVLQMIKQEMQQTTMIQLPEGFHQDLMKRVEETAQDAEKKQVVKSAHNGRRYSYIAAAAAAVMLVSIRLLPNGGTEGVDSAIANESPMHFAQGVEQPEAAMLPQGRGDMGHMPEEAAQSAKMTTMDMSQSESWKIVVSDTKSSYDALLQALQKEGYTVQGTPYNECEITMLTQEQKVGLEALVEKALVKELTHVTAPIGDTLKILLQIE